MDLINTTLFKSPEARPDAKQVLEVLSKYGSVNNHLIVIPALQKANTAELERRTQLQIEREHAQASLDRRSELYSVAVQSFKSISSKLKDSIIGSAPAVEQPNNADEFESSWFLRLNNATLEIPPITAYNYGEWDSRRDEVPAFEVIATTELNLRSSLSDPYINRNGRSHSLWFCDAQEKGRFKWYETAFWLNPLYQGDTRIEPFSLAPNQDSAIAVSPVMSKTEVAWPFTPLEGESLVDFITRWGTWFARTAEDGYRRPSSLPERDPYNSWRRG